MSTENIDIRVREDGSRVVVRNFQDLGSSADKAGSSVDFLKKALGALTAVLAIDKIKQYADAWSNAAGLIAVATKSTEEQIAVQDKLYAVAQKTRSGFTDVVELYARAARAGSELGASQNQVIKFTEGIGKALVIQHTSATQAAGSLLQLGQLLGTGKVRAQEFNSVNENLSTVLKVVAENTKGADGSIAKLKQQLEGGKLTSKAFFDAFLAGADKLDESFQKSSRTIAQGLTVINNAFTRYIGELDHAIGSSQLLGQIADFIGNNMKQLATILVSVGIAVAVAFAPGVIAAFAASLARLFVLLNANPFIALASAAAGLAFYFSQVGDTLLVGVDDITTFNDVFRAFIEYAKAALPTLLDIVKDVFTGISDVASAALKSVDTEGAVSKWTSDIGGFYSDVGNGFQGVVRGIAKTFDAIGGLIIGLVIGAGAAIGPIPGLFKEVFDRAYNAVVGSVEDMINTIIEGLNRLRAFVGSAPLELVKFEKLETDAAAFQKYGQGIADSIDKGFEIQGNALLKSVDDVFSKAQQIAKDRIAAIKPPANVNLDTPIGKPTKIVDEKELQKVTNALRALLDKILPSAGAVLELAKAEKTLTEAQKLGLITQAQHTQYLALAKQHYEDIINPLGKLNRELDDQTKLLGFNSRERAIQQQLLNTEKDLKTQGIKLSEAETKALKERYEALQRLNEVVAAQDQLLAASVDKKREFTTQLIAIQNLLADPNSGFGKGDAAQALNAQLPDLFAGTQVQLDANAKAYENMYAQIDELRAKSIISEETFAVARAKVAQQQRTQELKSTDDFFGNLATLQQSGNAKLAAIGKVAAIAQATLKGYVAVQEALASGPPPYNYIAAAAVGVAAAANVAKIAGFESGGYTGNGGTSNVAGVVHGQEYVVNAQGTSRNRAALEAINAGGTVGGSNVSVVVNNNAPGTKATTTERNTPNGREIEVTVAEIVSKDIRSGGPISNSIETQYGVNRAAGTVR